jgi:hypothetical protein
MNGASRADDLHNTFNKIDQQREIQKEADLLASKENSRRRLQDAIKKKMTTTMIGSLDSFEKRFAYLWAGGLPFSELTENQKDFRDLWTEVRNEVLNKGNSQLRAIMQEIDEYETLWMGKKYNFTIVEKKND